MTEIRDRETAKSRAQSKTSTKSSTNESHTTSPLLWGGDIRDVSLSKRHITSQQPIQHARAQDLPPGRRQAQPPEAERRARQAQQQQRPSAVVVAQVADHWRCQELAQCVAGEQYPVQDPFAQ